VENALPLFGLAALVAASALAIRVLASWWLRSKQLEVAERGTVSDASLTAIEARLARIEQIVETTAVEVERIAEAQRFTSKLLAEQRPQQSLFPGRSAEKP
jgi:hypothetical protein